MKKVMKKYYYIRQTHTFDNNHINVCSGVCYESTNQKDAIKWANENMSTRRIAHKNEMPFTLGYMVEMVLVEEVR